MGAFVKYEMVSIHLRLVSIKTENLRKLRLVHFLRLHFHLLVATLGQW